MPTKPRLFFSHSTRDGSAERKILTDLAKSLEKKYAILLDREALVPGEDWRPTINFWIRACDAAVILVTPESIESEYCQYEWAILSYRRKQQGFLIIPVYYGATPEQISGKPHQISEISSYLNYDNGANVSERVRSQLDQRPVLDQPGRLHVLYIAKLLKQAVQNEQTIEIAANAINLELGAWDLSVDSWGYFANKAMGIGIRRATPALLQLQQYFGKKNEDELRDIVDLIGFCSWVDIASAQRIKQRAEPTSIKQDPIGLNAEQVRTAICYVLSGSERAPNYNWPVATALGVFGSYEDLHRQIGSALREALQLNGEEDDAEIKQLLDEQQTAKQPVFIVLRADGLSRQWIEDLCGCDLFARVNFLILTGEGNAARGLLSDDALLTPELPQGFEHEVWKTYESTKRILRLA